MKLKILATTILLAPLCLATTAKAENPISIKQLLAVQPCLSCNSNLLAQSTWKQFSSDKGKFTVLMPSTPTEEKETDTDGAGSVSYTFTVSTQEGAFLINYADFPEQITQENPQELFDLVSEGYTSDGDKLLSKRELSLAGNPGREVNLKSSDGIAAKVRMYLVGSRLYQVFVIAPEGEDSEKFLNSFQLTK